ncbi:mitotic interactor and substrate of PLK1 [Lissotriton helveticus]
MSHPPKRKDSKTGETALPQQKDQDPSPQEEDLSAPEGTEPLELDPYETLRGALLGGHVIRQGALGFGQNTTVEHLMLDTTLSGEHQGLDTTFLGESLLENTLRGAPLLDRTHRRKHQVLDLRYHQPLDLRVPELREHGYVTIPYPQVSQLANTCLLLGKRARARPAWEGAGTGAGQEPGAESRHLEQKQLARGWRVRRTQVIAGGAREGGIRPVGQEAEGAPEPVQEDRHRRRVLEQEPQSLLEAKDPSPGMDRVTRSLVTSTPNTQTHREVLGDDGTLYTIETRWEERYMDRQPRYNGSQWVEEDASNDREYIITNMKTGSLERKPLINYRDFSATPSRVTDNYSPTDGIHRADLWVPSPDRDSKLELVRKGELYDLRAYKEDRKPAKLYSESDEELEYHIVAVEASPDRLRELEDERKRIIEGQKVKMSPLRQWRSMGELGSEADSPPTSPRKMPETSATEFDGQFGTPDSRSKSFNQENVDTEQINFLAARQQFLMLEQRKPDLLQGLKPQSRPLKPSEPTGYVYEREWQVEDGSPYTRTAAAQLSYYPGESPRGEAGGYEASLVPSLEDEMVGQQRARVEMEEPESGKRRAITRQLLVTSSREHMDSGNDEGFGAGYGSDGGTSREGSGNWHVQDSGTEPPTRYETPIEKEIRLALEREEELRRERGIQGSASTQEMIAIFKTPLLYRSPPSTPPRKSKESRRGSYFIQREIEMDSKREDDLISQGKVVGLYHKGPLEEVGERKKRFELDDEVPVLPVKSIHYKSPDLDLYERNSSFVPVEMQEQNQAQNVSPEVTRRSREEVTRIPLEAYAPYLLSSIEGAGEPSVPAPYTHFSRYDWHPSSDHDLQTPKHDEQAKADEQDSSVTPKKIIIVQKEYFSWKPWTPTLSPVVTAQDPPDEPPPRLKPSEKALYQEQSFTMKPLRTHTSSLIEREIQEVLQREEELQQQRRMLSQQPSGSSSADLSGTLPDDSQEQDQASGSPDRHVVSLFSTSFQPLVLNIAPASDQDLPGGPTDQTYSPAPRGPATPPHEWETRTPGKLKQWQLEEFERGQIRDRDRNEVTTSSGDTRGSQSPGAVPGHGGSPDKQVVSPDKQVVSLFAAPFRPLAFRTAPDPSWDTALREESPPPAHGVTPKGPAPPPLEWKPRTPGKLRDEQLEEFERGSRRQRDECGESRGFESPGPVPGQVGSPDKQVDSPDKQVVSLFAAPFRPLAFRTAPDPSWDTALREESAPPAYGVAPKGPAPPPLEWEPRTPGKLRDEQLEEFERRSRRQRDECEESRGFESPGPVPGQVGSPDRYVVSLFSTPLRPLFVGTAPSASSDSALRREPTYQTYSVTPKGPAPPPPEWETRTPGRLKDSQLEEFEDRRSRQRDEYGYAGIDPRDDVNNEIVESTRVSRRKSAMALRWEAGQYLNTQDDDDE